MAIVVAAVLWLGIDQLADVTQTRPDVAVAGSSSEVVFSVATKRYEGTLEEAANALWAACGGTIPSVDDEAGVTPRGEATFQVTVRPAIGPNAKDRLRGCLADATIDRVTGRVITIRHLEVSPD